MDFPRFQPAGDCAVLVTLCDQIDASVNQRIHGLARTLREQCFLGLREVTPGYATLLVEYDPISVTYESVEASLRQALDTIRWDGFAPHYVEVPVIYGGEFGPDLHFVAETNGLSEADVIRIHSERDYPIYMMGFTPGFPYLGGLDERIAAPRLETPRSCVPAGSVGIAGNQTGIYPLESPGGWRIIGKTALRLFDPSRESPFLLHPGDLIRFVPVRA